jgi:hypothetical protein
MAGIRLENQTSIYKSGQPLTALHLITDGTVQVRFPGGFYQIGKGDVIGICELCSDIHFLDYVATSDVSILTYPIPNPESLVDSIQKHPDVAGLFIISTLKQMTLLIEYIDASALYCNSLYQEIENTYHLYLALSSRYHIPPQEPAGFSEIYVYLPDVPLDIWLNSFYVGMLRIAKSGNFNTVFRDAAVSMGILHRSSLDFRKIFSYLEDQRQYQQELFACCFCHEGNDLFSLLTTLYRQIITETKDVEKLLQAILHICDSGKEHALLSPDEVRRIQTFTDQASKMAASLSKESSQEEEDGLPSSLINSLEVILQYAGGDLETTNSFRLNIHTFKGLKDRFSIDDEPTALRRQITAEFYTLYSVLFEKSLSQKDIPPAVMMFLYFGYIDEQLAGVENSRYLYNLTRTLNSGTWNGVYTLYDWLLAVYREEKEPSRNELDQSYTEYIQKQKSSGAIKESEWNELHHYGMSKVTYELRNMFPAVNKITYGRIATFCPIFVQDSIFKELDNTLVTEEALKKALDHVRRFDHSAFCRETLDVDYPGVKFFYTREYIPDIILMPNAGVRGVMWQEVEGRNRFTPARFMFSIFHMEDLTTTMLRVTAEYRWEICKRIQGSHWNDIREKSLTSEYCSYVQFYRKNHDLTSDAKEKIRSSLQQARNSYKEMFVRDYLQWIMFEANGAPRLNKVARGILFQYCPFSEKVCQKLMSNPFYTDLLTKRANAIRQKQHFLTMLEQKLALETQIKPETQAAIQKRLDNEKKLVTGSIIEKQ